eukprot:CAMPEP_0205806072 /NCGR_PEP_ID=MMETSP0205-20121125/9477_1 /ASSEMBLY_ACC=CAM_ASM_000278 /TAXON_ID=36767 /ORGANISM="Euplotes focardii, Strain TN1" /LENGTH=130 /DNA_ID=CAMNT_0053078287 /DNA_START=318 /DNA_END=707 /DNA_ORIENTATION=+
MIPLPKLKKKGYMVDYLLKKRIQRQQKEFDYPGGQSNKKINWEKLAGNSTRHVRSSSNAYEDSIIPTVPKSRFDHEIQSSEDQILKQRLEIIKNKAKQIEEEAIEKEKNMMLTTGTNVKDSNEINGLLIN